MYASANRDQGEKDSNGNQIRAAAPAPEFKDFRTRYSRRSLNLASKFQPDPVDHSLYGASANKEAFDAWAGGSLGIEFVPTKED